MKKIATILLDLLLVCILVLASMAVIFTIFSSKDADGATDIFGYQLRLVTSHSMGECEHTDVSGYEIKSIPVKSLIAVQTVPEDKEAAAEWYRNLKVGDVLTFRYVYGRQITITHRIASITEKEGGYIIELAGDNKNAKDNQLYQTIDTSIPDSPNYVVGKVTWAALWPGQLLATIKTPIGLVFLIWIPCIVVMLVQGIKIFFAAGEESRAREYKVSRNK